MGGLTSFRGDASSKEGNSLPSCSQGGLAPQLLFDVLLILPPVAGSYRMNVQPSGSAWKHICQWVALQEAVCNTAQESAEWAAANKIAWTRMRAAQLADCALKVVLRQG